MTVALRKSFGERTSSGFTRFVRLTLGARIELTSDQGTNIGILPPPDLAMPTWVDVEMTITGRTVTASMAIGGPLRPIGMLDLPSGMTDPIALDVLVQSGEATPEVPMLERLRLERLDLPACGRDEVVPQMREDGYDLVLDVVRGGAGGDLGCAISTADGVGRPYTAHGDGAWQPAPMRSARRDDNNHTYVAWLEPAGLPAGTTVRYTCRFSANNRASMVRPVPRSELLITGPFIITKAWGIELATSSRR